MFIIGVGALIAACLTRPLVPPDPLRQLNHDLAEARRLLHRQAGDPAAALQVAQRAVDTIMFAPERAAEAFYLLGSAHIRVAESGEGASAAEHWRQAKQYLEEAQRRGVSDDETARLNYRLAKVSFHNNDNPQQVIALLKASKDQADDRAEAYSLLSQAYLRLNPPNLLEALHVIEELRTKVPQIGEDVLGPAKLAAAKILLRLNRSEDARKTLEKINDQAPPAVLAEARMLLAARYQEDRKWAAAAELWKAVLNEKRVPLSEPGGVLYNLGVCCRQLDQLGKAAEAWTECLERTKGAESQAAALALAELRLQESNPEKALDLLRLAMSKVRKPEDWKNSLIELARVRDLFERAVQTYRQANRFDLAMQAAELYERVAGSSKAQTIRAELGTEWARSTREQIRLAKDPESRAKIEATTSELFRQAARSHDEAAKLVQETAEKNEHQWYSAICSFDGHDYPRAAEKLAKILETDMENSDRAGEGWFWLGESYRHMKNQDSAVSAYMKCVENDTHFTCRARYQLAMIDIQAGKIDRAASNLEQNLGLEHSDPDPEAQEKSRFALCSLLYHSGSKLPQNYRKVVVLLEGTLDRFTVSPEAVRARFQLADSYRQMAAQRTVNHYISENMSPETRDHYLTENRSSLKRAAEEFAKLEELLKNPELAGLLTIKQRVEVPFIVAQCRFNLGEYETALRKYEELAARFVNRPEALWAMGGTVQCFGGMGDFQKLSQRADQISAMLPNIAGLSEVDKQQWSAWLIKVKKMPPPVKERERTRDQPRAIDERTPVSKPDRP